jgi:prevent-host-death family protein
MKRVGIAELKDSLSQHLRAVETGEIVEVTDRARPVARIVPIERHANVTIRPARRPFAAVRDLEFEPLRLSVSADDLLREERRERLDEPPEA